jgi:predicted DNA-binding protein
MMYTAVYMASRRTQLYLTDEQRRRLDVMGKRKHKKMAEMVREAVTAYLAGGGTDAATALDATFGAAPDLDMPSRDEWDRSAPR